MNKRLSRVSEISDIPNEILSHAPKIAITDNCRISIENHKGILFYTEDNISIKLIKGNISVYGSKLSIKEINSEIIVLTGCIFNVKFENME